MKKPSKASFAEAKEQAAQLGKPVICGWNIMQNLRSPATVSWPKHGRADQKSWRWFRQNFREAWIVLPDGTGYDAFDTVPPQPI